MAPAGAVTIGQIGLAEAGNLGDDLILMAALRAVSFTVPDAQVRYLSFGQRLDWNMLRGLLGITVALERVPVGKEYVEPLRAHRAFSDCHAILFGGGGLLETSHNPYRPYHWLRYLGRGRHHPPALAVGLGIGPLSDPWMVRLKRGPDFFETCWLRDEGSAALATTFGWEAQLCLDYVDGALLGALGLPPGSAPKHGPLGVSLRAWPGLDAPAMATHIESVAEAQHSDRVAFFVLESKDGAGPDVDFTRAVRRALRVPSTELVYSAGNLVELLQGMASCASAVSMKLHAGAVWTHLGAPVYPVIYAPKVSAMFDLPYRGLQILDHPVAAPPPSGRVDLPSAPQVVQEWLPRVLGERATRSGFSTADIAWLGAASTAHLIGGRLCKWLESARITRGR